MGNKGMKSSHVAVIVVTFLVVIGAITYAFITSTSKPTININQPGTTTVTGTTPAGNCTTYFAQNLQVALQWFNASKIPLTPNSVYGQTINVYRVGDTQAYKTATSGATANSISGINCNTKYVVGAGDSSTFFLNFSNITTGTSANPTVTLTLQQLSTPTIQVQNSSTGTFASTARLHIPGSTTVTSFGLTVKAGTYWLSQGPGALVFVGNSGVISQITLGTATPVNPGLLPPVNGVTSNSVYGVQYQTVGVQNNQWAFYLPACVNSQYSTPSGCVSGQAAGTMNPTIYLKSTGTANELIQVYWIPATGLYNTAPQFLGGIGPKLGQFVFPQNQTAISTRTTTYNAIQITPQ